MLSRRHFLDTPPARLGFAAPQPAPAAAAAPSAPQAAPPQANAAPQPRPPRTPSADDGLLPRAPHASERHRWREVCDCLELFRICRAERCRRAGRCGGDPVACLRSGVRLAPDAIREFARCLLHAQNEGLSFEDAFEDSVEHHEPYFCWIAGLSAERRG
jgi:hypothetical protein